MNTIKNAFDFLTRLVLEMTRVSHIRARARRAEHAEPRIVATVGTSGGKPRIAGRRITVQHIVLSIQGGMTPWQVAEEYDLSLEDVNAATQYFIQHHNEIVEDMRNDEAVLAELTPLPQPC